MAAVATVAFRDSDFEQDSSDDEHQQQKKQRADDGKRARERDLFDKDAVLAAVEKLGGQRQLPALFTPAVLEEWRAWHEATPTSLDAIPASERQLHVAMPMKCSRLPARAPPPSTGLPVQVELISYDNSTAENSKTAKELQRDAEAVLAKHLVSADVPIGSLVAITKQDGGEGDLPGEATPFLVGSVVQVELVEESNWNASLQQRGTSISTGGTSSSSGGTSTSQQGAAATGAATEQEQEGSAQHVKRILVHYLMPYANRKFCDDVRRPWKLACLCRQEWNHSHERYIECKRRYMDPTAATSVSAVLQTTRYVDWIQPDMVLETQLGVTPTTSKLSADTKQRLIHNCPRGRDASIWKAMFG